MAGATATYPPNVAPVRAVLAGADQLLVAPQMDTAYGAVLAAVRSGEISKQRLDESVYRILLHKFQRGLFKDSTVDVAAAPQIMGAPRAPGRRAGHHRPHHDAGQERCRAAAARRPVRARCWSPAGAWARPRRWPLRSDRARCHDGGPRVGNDAVGTAVANAVASAQTADLVVVSTNNAYAVDGTTGQPTAAAAAQTRLVRALLATGKPVIVAAMRNPYDVASFPEAPTVVDTFGYTTHQVESLVRVLFGEVNPRGRLPVSIPKADGSGVPVPVRPRAALLTGPRG